MLSRPLWSAASLRPRSLPALFTAALGVAALGGGCSGEHDKAAGRRANPGADFVGETSVRVTSPAHGAAVSGDFVLEVRVGSGLDSLEISSDGAPHTATVLDGSDTVEVLMSLEPGRHDLEVVGLDAAGVAQNSHALSVIVEGQTSWVSITSPRDGATVTNPVHFTVNSSSNVDQIEIFADDWSLGTVAPDQVLTYAFTGTDYAREVVAVAYDDGVEVASHELTITVTEGGTATESDFNDMVMSHVATYPTDGSYAYWWPDDVDWGGNPHDIYYEGDLFSAGDPERRSYCVGMTFEVFMRAFEDADALTGGDGSVNGVAFDELYELRTDWYVRDLYGSGVVEAVENYGIGEEVVAWEDVRPGDFLQFWRHSGSGHNAIFIDWERDSADNITGFTYWSTQGSTDGVGYNQEYFGSSGSRVDPSYFFVARVAMPWDWIPWH